MTTRRGSRGQARSPPRRHGSGRPSRHRPRRPNRSPNPRRRRPSRGGNQSCQTWARSRRPIVESCSGQISRGAFADFFATIGLAGPVEIFDDGNFIGSASGGETFLTCVNAGPAYLVFPSYDFIANQSTHFATIASVPKDVGAVFTLERGDGELILETPAIYQESETGLRRVEKGEIRGFGG